MLSTNFSSSAYLIFCFLTTTTYAFPSYPHFVSSLFADRHNVSSSNMLKNLNVSRVLSIEALSSQTDPEWDIVCETDGHPDRSVNSTDCLHIATEIENSAGATSYRVYKGTDHNMEWRHGDCSASLEPMLTIDTDVFKPILIALSIRRIVERCGYMVPKMGGRTLVGPRRKFEVFI